MPVISYNLPSGTLPIQGTRNRFIDWLVEHVGPVKERAIMYSQGVNRSATFGKILNEYHTVIGTDWEYSGYIDRIVVTRAEYWSIWQLTADTNPMLGQVDNKVYQYAVYMVDEILAVQFKLSCL